MARKFNGSGDQILATTIAWGNHGQTWTAAGWVYPTSTTNDLLPYGDGNLGSNGWGFLQRSASGVGTNWAFLFGGIIVLDGAVTLSLNTWSHLAWTGDGANPATNKAYTNGVLTNTIGPRNGPTVPSGGNVTLGGSTYDGRIADCALWNITLTAGEVAALASGARPYRIRRSGLLAWWPIDGLASPEPDYIAANNGTVTGTTFAIGPPYMPLTPRWEPSDLFVPPPPPPFNLMPQIVT